jgi:predicted DNA-binding transcriptional regulator AlpA
MYHFPPRQMRAPAAAYYCGVSEQTFLDRVKAGIYPAGIRDGGCRVWLRDDLDAMIDRQHGVSAGGAANDGSRSGSWSRFSKAG